MTNHKSPMTAEDYTPVRTEVLLWLLGERGDFECPPEQYFRGKPAPYFWRSHLRNAMYVAHESMRATLKLAKEPPMPAKDDETTVKAAMRFAESQGFVIAENDYEAETRYGDFCAGWHAARKTPNVGVNPRRETASD